MYNEPALLPCPSHPLTGPASSYDDILSLQNSQSPLFASSNNGHLKVVKTLIEAGANVNQCDMVCTIFSVTHSHTDMYGIWHHSLCKRCQNKQMKLCLQTHNHHYFLFCMFYSWIHKKLWIVTHCVKKYFA